MTHNPPFLFLACRSAPSVGVHVRVRVGGRLQVRVGVRVGVRFKVRVRCFCRNRGPEVGAVCTAVLRKEEVEDLHLGCGWKGGSAAGLRLGLGFG